MRALVLAALIAAPVALAVDATIARPPNIIIYLADDLGYFSNLTHKRAARTQN